MRHGLEIALLAISGRLIQEKRNIVVGNAASDLADWSLRLPAVCNGYLLCIAVCKRVFRSAHVIK